MSYKERNMSIFKERRIEIKNRLNRLIEEHRIETKRKLSQMTFLEIVFMGLTDNDIKKVLVRGFDKLKKIEL